MNISTKCSFLMQHKRPHDIILPPKKFTVGSILVFPPKVTMVVLAKQFQHKFQSCGPIRPQEMSSKMKIFVPVYACKLCSGIFNVCFEGTTSSSFLKFFYWSLFAHFGPNPFISGIQNCLLPEHLMTGHFRHVYTGVII